MTAKCVGPGQSQHADRLPLHGYTGSASKEEKRKGGKKRNKINTWLSRCSYSSSVAVVDVSGGRCTSELGGKAGRRQSHPSSERPGTWKNKKREKEERYISGNLKRIASTLTYRICVCVCKYSESEGREKNLYLFIGPFLRTIRSCFGSPLGRWSVRIEHLDRLPFPTRNRWGPYN